MDCDTHQPFTGRRLLIVEDEFLIALELKRIIEELGGSVIGPVGSVESALQLLSNTTADAALLDVNLRERRVMPVAEACQAKGIPFALVTAYGRLELDQPLLQSAPRVHKPFDRRTIRTVLTVLLKCD